MIYTSRIISYLPSKDDRNNDFSKKVISCKFIVISNDDKFTLIYGLLSDYPYHANILARYCEECSITSSWERKPDMFQIYAKNCHMNGGGWLELDYNNKILKVFGYSTVYGKYRYSDVTKILSDQEEFNDFKIIIEK